jgi:ubiquinone/menaquinone biosynthesis C-methylase UbiE
MKAVLDACCGGKMFWFDKNNHNTVYMDIRSEEHILCDGRKFVVSPDIVSDFKNIPYPDETFSLVVFDPPHLKAAGKTSYMRLKYGQLGQNWQSDIKQGFDECWRVLKPNGTLVFKWSEGQIPLSKIFPLMPVKPLFGNNGRGRTKPQAHWIVFFKSEKGE